jgi:hypothetical protein
MQLVGSPPAGLTGGRVGGRVKPGHGDRDGYPDLS